MNLIKMIKDIRYRWHRDIVWKDYRGDLIAHDTMNSNLISSYLQNEFLIRNIGIEKIKNLPDYLYMREIHDLTQIYKVTEHDKNLVRVGKNDDGGYVMIVPFSNTKIAYSFGINKDVSWDDMVADYGYDVFMYDHTIDKLPFSRKEFHWNKIGVVGSKETKSLKRVETLMSRNGHMNESGMILKMDVEGAEWDVFNCLDIAYLDKFDQIVMEMHGLLDVTNREIIKSVLRKINSKFACVNIHANNYSRVMYLGDLVLTDTMEITLINRRNHCVVSESVILPTVLDRPCDSSKMDIYLGEW